MRLVPLLLFASWAAALFDNPFLDVSSESGNALTEDRPIEDSPVEHVVKDPAQGFIDPHKCTVDDGCDNTFSSIDTVNSKIRLSVESLVKSNFFRYFKLQLYKECPFWKENPMCFSPSCAVEIEDSSFDTKDGSHAWKLNYNNVFDANDTSANHSKKIVEYNCDYCNTAEENQADAVYVDLTLNPERYSGYGGEEAARIWRSIYQENCFNNPIDVSQESQDKSPAPRFNNKYFNILAQWSNKIQRNLNINNYSRLASLMNQEDDQCLEKRVFYRLISGMHASIATHLSFQWLDTTKKNAQFEPNLNLWMQRVGYFGDRLSNIYFNYLLVIKAILKLSDYLNEIQFSPNNHEVALINDIVSLVKPYENSIFKEDLLFNYEDDLSNQLLKNEFKTNFKNVSSLMDCVGCERCRLWGKVQTLGYGTSLKILFELNDNNTEFDVKSLKRSEIIALINTFERLSKSVQIINFFRAQYQKQANLKKDDASITSPFSPVSSSDTSYINSQNNKVVSYQQKIFKEGSENIVKKDSFNFQAENQRKVDGESEIIESEQKDEYPSSIKQQNVDESKKALKKLFQDKQKAVKPISNKEGVSFDSADELEEEEEDFEGLTKDEIRYRQIFRNSIKLKRSKPYDQKTFQDHWLEVIEEFKDVFKFLWDSYINFPKNLYGIVMSRLENYWNLFIGNEEYFINKRKELHRLNHNE